MLVRAAVVLSLLGASFFPNTVSAQQPAGIAAQGVDVLTYHNNSQRTGLNSLETVLTPSNVNWRSFGKVAFLPTDDRVRAQPLYVSGLSINGVQHNVVYVVTDKGSIYAFDADNDNVLWKTTALLPGETQAPFSNRCPEAGDNGIVATPVLDRSVVPDGAIYFVAASYEPMTKAYHHRLHALDLTTGAELFSGPTEIKGKYPGTGDNSFDGYVVFDPSQYFVRAGLIEANGNIYFGFASLCDERPYTGWLMQYSAYNLRQLYVLNLTPNGNEGSIWQAGGGIAADRQGYLYILYANGTFDTTLDGNGFPSLGDYGNAFLKISNASFTPLKVVDYFNMYNTVEESDNDADLGSGSAMVVDVPSGKHAGNQELVVGAGKDTNIYVADPNHMGKWNPLNNDNIYQVKEGAVQWGIFGSPAFFNNTVYFGPLVTQLRAFPFVLGRLQDASSQTSLKFPFPGTTPSISSNGTNDGIVWAVENNETGIQGSVLHAYDALDLGRELYNSSQANLRDSLGMGNHFVTPMIVNGKVYIATRTGVAVFGLLNNSSEQGSQISLPNK